MRTGRVVVITGAAGGMGRRFAGRFLENGDVVVAADRSVEGLATLAREAASSKLYTRTTDVADEASCSALASFATQTLGRVDVLLNCAGFFPTQPFDQMTLAEWNEVVSINLTGPFLVAKAILPLMRGRGWGRIVNIGSGSVFEGVAEQAHYVAAKAGVVGFSRSLARIVGKDGITVNVVAPGLTLTSPVVESLPPELIEAQPKARAIARNEMAGDLVGAVFFLTSPDADFISGQTLNVDGGKQMQ